MHSTQNFSLYYFYETLQCGWFWPYVRYTPSIAFLSGWGSGWVSFLLSDQTKQSKNFTKEEDVPMVALSFFWCQLHAKIFLYYRKNFVHRTKKIKNFQNLKFLDVKKCDFMGIFVILSDFLYNLYIPRVLTFQLFLIWVSFFLLLGNSRKWLEVLYCLVYGVLLIILRYALCDFVWFSENLCDPVRIFENLWDFLRICVICFLHFLGFFLRFFFESSRTVRPTFEKVLSEK